MGLLWRCARPALFTLPAEQAHGLALRILKTGLLSTGRKQNLSDPRLQMQIGQLKFPNPLGLAAGFDKNGEVVDGILQLGFSHVEIGTVTPRPQSGNPRPRLFRLGEDKALINRMGFNNEGHAALLPRLSKNNRVRQGLVGLNIGANKDSANRLADYAQAIAAFYERVDYFTVNVSSPNTPGLRDLQARDMLDELLRQLHETRAAKAGGRDAPLVPIFLKIAPDLHEAQLDDIASVICERGGDGLVISNTTLSRDGLTSPKMSEAGGLSGKPLFERSTIVLAKMRQRLGTTIPIIGVGGIEDGQSALEKIRAGADLIQLYSAMIYKGPVLVPQILRELVQFCERDGVVHLRSYRDQHVELWAKRPL